MSKPKTPRALKDNEAKCVARMLRVSPQKLNLLAQLIRGKPVETALADLEFSRKRIAGTVKKALESAIANAENNHEPDTEDMVVRSAVATPGPTLKRITPRARGSAGAIKKRLCHITVVLAAGKEESDEGSSTSKVAVKKAAPRKRPAAKKAEQA